MAATKTTKSAARDAGQECDYPQAIGCIAFPLICSALGGAQLVRYNSRTATITRADGSEVKAYRCDLPALNTWTAFNLADAVAHVRI